MGSVVVAHGPSCSAACGIFPDQGLNPCPLHWQADSQPLRHQGSPEAQSLNHWTSREVPAMKGFKLGNNMIRSEFLKYRSGCCVENRLERGKARNGVVN